MEDELARIKSVLNECPTNEDKIAFLLRQVEWLLKTRDSYRTETTKNRTIKEIGK